MAEFFSQRSLFVPTFCVFMSVWQLLSFNREQSEILNDLQSYLSYFVNLAV